MFLFCLVFAMFCARLFICASWSPAGKGLTSWLSFVVSSVSFTFPLVSWVRCGTWLYRFLIFATLLTLTLCSSVNSVRKWRKKLFQLKKADYLKVKWTDNVNYMPCLPLLRRFVVDSVVFDSRYLHLFWESPSTTHLKSVSGIRVRCQSVGKNV